MLFGNPEKKREEYLYQNIRNNVYLLTHNVHKIAMRTAVRTGSTISLIEPYKTDMPLLLEMSKSFKYHTYNSFFEIYGKEYHRLINYYSDLL